MINEKIKKPLIIYLSISAILIIVFIIIKLIHFNPYGKELPISNFKQLLPDTNQTNQDAVFNILYQAVSSTQENMSDEDILKIKDASIRENSLQTNTINNITSVSFLVDIPSIQQSYKISFAWGNQEVDSELENYSISCPSQREKIFDTICYLNQEDDPNLTIKHDYLLNSITDSPFNSIIYETVLNYINSKNEYLTGNKVDQKVELVINESSFQESYINDDYLYSISADTDDGRSYYLLFRIYASRKEPGVAVLIDRLDINNHQYAKIISVENTKITNRFQQWLKEESGNKNLTIDQEILNFNYTTHVQQSD